MIGKDQIAEAARYADALVEERGMPYFWRSRDIDFDGLTHVAMQRALRVVMIERGEDPNVTKPTPVTLTATEQLQLIVYAGMFMDGFAAGFTVKED